VTVSASVVIPMHNGASYIEQQLDGLLLSLRSSPNTEFIVVDNRSIDLGPALVAEWARKNSAPIRVIPGHERAGEPYARNVGWQAARSEKILFCDADDVVSPGWLGALSGALDQYRYATGPLDTSRLNHQSIADLRGQALFRSLPTLPKGIPFAHGCNMGFRRRTLEDLAGFDETYLIACDVEIAVRAWQRDIDLGWAPGALVHYRLRSTVPDVYQQARAYARARRRIDRLVSNSPSTVDWRHQGRRAAWLVRHLPQTAAFAGRMKWAWVAGQVAGELGGRKSWKE